MGINIRDGLLLARTISRHGLTGRLLQLGRQDIRVEEEQFNVLLKENGFLHVENGAYHYRHQETFNSLVQQNRLYRLDRPGKTFDDKAFFGLLGLEAHSCDYSDYEGAEVLLDLNAPSKGPAPVRYDVVLDGGTMEHVFNVANVLANIDGLLAPGGCVIHVNPTNNAAEHGFYQFSPTFYWDYYTANNYDILESKLIVYSDLTVLPMFMEYTPDLYCSYHRTICFQDTAKMFFVARKREDSTVGVAPIQRTYTKVYGGPESSVSDFTRWKIENALAEYPAGTTVALWCAGAFAEELLASSEAIRLKTAFVVDGDEAKQGRSIHGKPIVSPDIYKARTHELRAVVVATPNSVGVYAKIADDIGQGLNVILA